MLIHPFQVDENVRMQPTKQLRLDRATVCFDHSEHTSFHVRHAAKEILTCAFLRSAWTLAAYAHSEHGAEHELHQRPEAIDTSKRVLRHHSLPLLKRR